VSEELEGRLGELERRVVALEGLALRVSALEARLLSEHRARALAGSPDGWPPPDEVALVERFERIDGALAAIAARLGPPEPS
jgi:hypothetical protein